MVQNHFLILVCSSLVWSVFLRFRHTVAQKIFSLVQLSMTQPVWSILVEFDPPSPVWFLKLFFKLKSYSAPSFPVQEVS